MSEQPGDYGRYLQTHRRAKGMSLEAVAQKTKISMTCLRHIENEDGAGLPAPTFVKGFIRAYADVVGADARDALNRYETNNEVHQRQGKSDREGADRPGAFWGRMLLAFLLLAGLIGGTIYLIQHLDRSAQSAPTDEARPLEAPLPMPPPDSPTEKPVPPRTPVVDTPTVPVTPPQASSPIEPALSASTPPDPAEPASPSPAEPPSVVDTPPARTALPVAQQVPESPVVATPPEQAIAPPGVAKEKLVLTVTALELSWLRVTSDQDPPREMTLQPGHTATVEARERFRLLIGNAGGIRLALNDQPVSVPGRSGQVVTLQLP